MFLSYLYIPFFMLYNVSRGFLYATFHTQISIPHCEKMCTPDAQRKSGTDTRIRTGKAIRLDFGQPFLYTVGGAGTA